MKMLKARLEVLGLTVPLGLFNFYHDDGFVNSVDDYLKELYDKYGYERNLLKEYYSALGMRALMCGRFKTRHYHIFYLDNGNTPMNIHFRAHEETHVVDDLNCLDLLAEKILEEQRVRIDFEVWEKSGEIRAELGGIYALFAHNMTPGMIDKIRRGGPFKIAWRIYEGSRLPERKIFS